jgi:uncharacterized protein YdaU (DUF1376 family)
MKWYPRWPGDYGIKTGHLSILEHGVYVLLMDHYYANEAPLPIEADRLYRIARAQSPDEQAAVRRVVAEFFPANGDGTRHNKRADEEIAKAQAKSKANSRAALKKHGKA